MDATLDATMDDPATGDAKSPRASDAPEQMTPGDSAQGSQDSGPAEAESGEPQSDDSDSAQEKPSRIGPGEELSDEELVRRLTALLFASPEPLGVDRLVQLLQRPRRARVRAALEQLGQSLTTAGLPLEVRGLKGGYTLMTSADLGDVVARLAKGSSVERISPAALETLAVIAYRQPVTKAEVEAIRGVQAGPVLRSLVDRDLVRVLGRADVPGHPLEYGTSKGFLDRFGLLGLGDLPRDAELARD